MEQATFAELEHDSKKRRTRREVFLEKMDWLVPWAALEALIEPIYGVESARNPRFRAENSPGLVNLG